MANKLDEKIEEWRRKLLDLSKRNRLINCKIGTRGAIELEYPSCDLIWEQLVQGNGSMAFPWKARLLDEGARTKKPSDQRSMFIEDAQEGSGRKRSGRKRSERTEFDGCIQSPEFRPDHLLTTLADQPLEARLNRLALNAKTAITEQGVNVLYLAFGLLEWYESADSDVAMFSPLLLVPAQLQRDGPDTLWKLSLYEEDVMPNQCLHELLRSDFRLELPDIPETGLEKAADRKDYFDRVMKAVRKGEGNTRWEVLDKAVLNAFSFQKLAMWQDLKINAEQIAAHDICRAIAGDQSACVSPMGDLPATTEFDDRVHPRKVHTILDADSSQLEAILAVDRGMSLVLDGPPGTGKSQTIANIIAQAIGNGKKVLFVSEKAAALEVVKRRLDACNLGDFCLECHSHKANKKHVIAELGRCLSLPFEEYRDQSEDLDRLYATRRKLNDYVRVLHKTQDGALPMTPYAVHGRLARLRPQNVSRCAIPNVFAIKASTLREIVERLRSLTSCRAVVENCECHAWSGCKVTGFSFTLRDDIQHDFRQLAKQIDDRSDAVAVLTDFGLLPDRPSKVSVTSDVDRVKRILDLPQLPAAWLSEKARETANLVVEMSAATRAFQEGWQQLAKFRPAAIDADGDSLLAPLFDRSSPWIIVSVGYAYDEDGKFALRFGPLNRQGGERRLNVAVTRAREQVILVSSIHAADIDLSRTQAVGARLLRAYLEYAEHGVGTLGPGMSKDREGEADSEFETEVERALVMHGMNVRRQIGCGGFRIDLALVHPDLPERYVLGIECDGATYHRSATARDRDRLRQEILEGLGWRICRIWSTDWIRDPDRQIQRVLAAYEDALSRATEVSIPSGNKQELRESREEKPIVRLRTPSAESLAPRHFFVTISDVPSDTMREVILQILRRYGQTQREELFRAVARELGFFRTSKNIQNHIGRELDDLMRTKDVTLTEEGRLWAS